MKYTPILSHSGKNQISIRYLAILIVVLIYFEACKVRLPIDQSPTVTVFEPKGSAYASMRIPALVVSKKGTLLAFCEGRISSASDWAEMDMLLKRSFDGGKTWDAEQIIAPRRGAEPTSNATPIVDKNGTIHLLYQRGYAQAFYIKSEDDGKTWTEPVDVTYVFNEFKSVYNWKVLAPGPGHAIQLENGRLVVPIWLADSDKLLPHKSHRPSCIATIYSDDYGRTWKRGDIVATNNPDFKNPSETVAVQLTDGRVMLNIRNETAKHRRAVSYSTDGATNWSKPNFDEALYEPICMASLVKLPIEGKEGKTPLLFVNPDTQDNPKIPRKNLTGKISLDDGQNWTISKTLDSGFVGYSDLAIGKNVVYCLYESNETISRNYRIVLKIIPLKDLIRN
ncbi:sialidase family protein [Pedobacter sp. Du54]|uniref:sialidase family protein n=1 Tax=Pedobacter anseongensis TaxID=3133439 RepID=UPI0030A79F2A